MGKGLFTGPWLSQRQLHHQKFHSSMGDDFRKLNLWLYEYKGQASKPLGEFPSPEIFIVIQIEEESCESCTFQELP